MGFERNPLKSYRELDNPKLLLDTIFYRKSLEVTGINHLVSSNDGEALVVVQPLMDLKLLFNMRRVRTLAFLQIMHTSMPFLMIQMKRWSSRQN